MRNSPHAWLGSFQLCASIVQQSTVLTAGLGGQRRIHWATRAERDDQHTKQTARQLCSARQGSAWHVSSLTKPLPTIRTGLCSRRATKPTPIQSRGKGLVVSLQPYGIAAANHCVEGDWHTPSPPPHRHAIVATPYTSTRVYGGIVAAGVSVKRQ